MKLHPVGRGNIGERATHICHNIPCSEYELRDEKVWVDQQSSSNNVVTATPPSSDWFDKDGRQSWGHLYVTSSLIGNLIFTSQNHRYPSAAWSWRFEIRQFHASPILHLLKWHLACLNFIPLVISCIGLREEEPQTAYPMPFTWASSIATSMLTGR